MADSSLHFDTNEKRLLYAKAGIREYWVVDINGRRLLVYRDPQAGDYVNQQAPRPNGYRHAIGRTGGSGASSGFASLVT